MEKYSEEWILDKMEEIESESMYYENRKDCIYWLGYKQTTKRHNSVVYGYKCIKFPGENKCSKLTVHRLRYILHIGHKPSDSMMDVSHICHCSLCVNLDHLSLEPKSVNKSRTKCVNNGICSKHAGFPDCIL